MTVALFTHPACLEHETGDWHPECVDRLRMVLQALEHPDFVPLLREAAPLATREQLERAHSADHVAAILSTIPSPGDTVMLDGDTVMSHGSAQAALRAAGAAVAAVDAVQQGWARAAFAAVRPPGHHAERDRAMGFCLFNNAAIAALHAQARWGVGRVAVVDFDVHHGNGTQAIFDGRPNLFYASSHQYPCYPGTGRAEETGISGNIFNAPLPPGSDGRAFRAAWEHNLLPALDAFAPGALIVSAGFDAHRSDPLAELQLDVEDFVWLTGRLLDIAAQHCGGRLVSVLEGGYNLRALGASVAAHVRTLLRI
jgi:acetoin utilization deacetylase AcuC-like enzyme